MWLYLQYSLSIPSSLHFQIKISRQLQNRKEDIFGIIHWKNIYIFNTIPAVVIAPNIFQAQFDVMDLICEVCEWETSPTV